MTVGMGGSSPQFRIGGRTIGPPPFYKSERDFALILDKTIKKGYGILPAGTILCEAVGDSNGSLVPYCPTAVAATDVGRAFLVADASSTDLYTTIKDSYRFEVGDNVVGCDDTPNYTDLGAITAIDRTTHPNMAKITVTNALTATVADMANIYIKGGASGKFSDAKYILDSYVFTGDGEGDTPVGANAPVVVSNAILYKNMLPNLDTAAQTSLGATVDGKYVILK